MDETGQSSVAPEQYHLWYYNQKVWMTTNFLGVLCQKSVLDLWNYQEILFDRRPSLVIEFGTYSGGSALYFAEMLKLISPHGHVLSIDIDLSRVEARAREHSMITFLEADSVSASAAQLIAEWRQRCPGPAFFIVDSDHHTEHVFRELLRLRIFTKPEDYVVVEDSNINGHPVLPGWGPGPWEALKQYFAEFPDDYWRDEDREAKFGWTFAPRGFLIRR